MLMQSHSDDSLVYRTVPHACALAHARPTMLHIPLVEFVVAHIALACMSMVDGRSLVPVGVSARRGADEHVIYSSRELARAS